MKIEEVLRHAMHKIETGRTQGYAIPVHALHSMVSLSKGPNPGTFRVILTTLGEEQAEEVLTQEQVMTTILVLLQRNERLLEVQGQLLAAETELFLKEGQEA